MRSITMYYMTGLLQSMITEKTLPADLEFPVTFETRENGLLILSGNRTFVFSFPNDDKIGMYSVTKIGPTVLNIPPSESSNLLGACDLHRPGKRILVGSLGSDICRLTKGSISRVVEGETITYIPLGRGSG